VNSFCPPVTHCSCTYVLLYSLSTCCYSSSHLTAVPGVSKLQVPNIYHGASSHIDLSVPASKVQREQAMVSNVFLFITPVLNFSTR
jgi:hypothetical protein